MEQKPLTTQQVIDLITPIPEESFCINDYSRDNGAKCCILGFVNRIAVGNPNDWFQSIEDSNDYHDGRLDYSSAESRKGLGLRSRSVEYLKTRGIPDSIAGVNNEASDDYPQETPKQRVLALLNDMLAAGY